jgi:hypothetical protein
MTERAQPDTFETFGVARFAFRRACERVAAAPSALDAFMYASLTEACWWAICLDEELESAAGYKSARNSHPGGLALLGLRYARSMLGHHRVFAAENGGGLTIPLAVPFSIQTHAVWRRVEDLPDISRQDAVRRVYDDHLAGRSVVDTLDATRDWIDLASPTYGPGA